MLKTGMTVSLLTVTAMVSAADARNVRETHTIAEYQAMESQPKSLVYKAIDGLELRVLVMRPNDVKPGENRPALVWIHGGGWMGGNPEMFLPHMRYTAARGAVAFAVQYRLVPRQKEGKPWREGATISDCVADCADAIVYIRKHAAEFGVDTDRITAIGDSAGGHLAACLGTLPLPANARVNAVVDCNGITDFVDTKWRKSIKPGDDLDQRAAAVSPLRNLKADAPPILVLHGDKDPVVLPANARAFHDACRKLGIDTECQTWPDASHAFIVTGYTATDVQITRAILTADAFLLKRGLLDGPTSIHYANAVP